MSKRPPYDLVALLLMVALFVVVVIAVVQAVTG